MKRYMCNVCDEKFGKLSEITGHYRKEHPDEGWSCYDAVGDLGDPLGNSAMKHLWEKYKDVHPYKHKYEELAKRHNDLARKLITIQEVLGGSNA